MKRNIINILLLLVTFAASAQSPKLLKQVKKDIEEAKNLFIVIMNLLAKDMEGLQLLEFLIKKENITI